MINFLLDGVWWFTKKKQSSLQFVSAVMTKGFHVAFKPRMLEKKIKITQINDHIQKHHQDILELTENYFLKNICYAQLHTDSTSFYSSWNHEPAAYLGGGNTKIKQKLLSKHAEASRGIPKCKRGQFSIAPYFIEMQTGKRKPEVNMKTWVYQQPSWFSP